MQKSLNPLKFTEDIDSYYKINHFVATDDKYNHRYGTTLYFYEKCYIKSNKNHFKRDDHSKTVNFHKNYYIIVTKDFFELN
jgi:hypothetical protein